MSEDKARPVMELRCEFTYEAAHSLPMVPPQHKCATMHGHSYHLTVVVAGPVGANGFVVDFGEVKAVVAPVLKKLDHHTLNDIEGLSNPTVEVQLAWLWEQLSGLPLRRLELRETATNSAVYSGETEATQAALDSIAEGVETLGISGLGSALGSALSSLPGLSSLETPQPDKQ